MAHPPMRTILPTILAASALAAALTGCSAISGLFPQQAQRDSSSQEVVKGGESDVFALAVGDCFDGANDSTVPTVQTKPCSEPHDYEVYYDFDVPGDAWPGDDAVTAAAVEGCGAQFGPFVGTDYETSQLDFSYFTPVEDGWNDLNDHAVTCIVGDPGGKVTGTLAGAAR